MSDPRNSEIKEQYKKFDLVKLMGYDSAGIVLKVEYDGLNIMNEKGHTKNISYLEVDSKVTHRNAAFQNNFKDTITIDSTIKVLDGLHKGKIGTVKQIFKDVLFLFNQEFIPTNGFKKKFSLFL
jgi:transcription elongation factor